MASDDRVPVKKVPAILDGKVVGVAVIFEDGSWEVLPKSKLGLRKRRKLREMTRGSYTNK